MNDTMFTPTVLRQDVAPTVEFVNAETRTPLMLIIDTSGSTAGQPNQLLNEGMGRLGQDFKNDPVARNRIEISIVTFGGDTPTLLQDFTIASAFTPPSLSADGGTPLGAAIILGLDCVEQRKQQYKANGIDYSRPSVFIITDANSTDDYQAAAARVHEAETRKKASVFAIGFGDIDMNILRQIAPPNRPPLQLDGCKFIELIQWLSVSMRRISASKAGTQVTLPPPDTWAVTSI